jgi:hypothetical protein
MEGGRDHEPLLLEVAAGAGRYHSSRDSTGISRLGRRASPAISSRADRQFAAFRRQRFDHSTQKNRCLNR